MAVAIIEKVERAGADATPVNHWSGEAGLATDLVLRDAGNTSIV